MVRGFPAAAVALAVLFAGCTGSGEKPDDRERLRVEPGDPLGAVSGVIVDPTVTPIADAVVTLAGNGVESETTTDGEGRFVFQDLEPGFYVLEANAAGYGVLQSTVTVVAGEVAHPRLVLPPTAGREPYHVTVQRRAANVFSTPAVVVYPTPEYIDLDGPFEDLVVEGEWTGTIVSTDPEKTILTRLETDGWERRAETGQKLHLVFNGTGVAATATELAWSSWPGFNTVSVDAFAELFFTLWYHEGAPEGWSIYDGDL